MSLNSQVPAKENLPATTTMSSRLSASRLRVARAVWLLLGILAAGLVLSSLPGYAQLFTGSLPEYGHAYSPAGFTKFSQVFGGIASLTGTLFSLGLSLFIFRHRFKNPAAMAISFYLLIYGTVMTGVFDIWGNYWVGSTDFVLSLQGILLGTPTIALFSLFPNGKFVPSWMRWVLVATIPWNIVLLVFAPNSIVFSDLTTTFTLFSIWLIILPLLGIYAQVYRYQRVSTPDERHQTKWVMFGLALWIGIIVVSTPPYIYLSNLPTGETYPSWAVLTDAGWWISICILPISFMIAITRFRLWNVDIVVNRTLVYGGLTALTMGIYVFAVGYLGKLLHDIDQSLIAFFATGLIAVLFQPLREWIQRGVNRIMYGQRDDPFIVIAKLGEILEQTGSPEDALASIVETIAKTLKLPYAAIILGESDTSYGIPISDVLRIPLKYQNETIGYLVVGQRSQGEEFSSTDIKLLESIAHQAGAAAHAVRLTTDLRQSRQKLITMREEERRRIRRDLHDGLGPTLASLTLKLEAVRNFLHNSPDKAESLIDELKTQTVETIQDIRRLVYDLRPPTLDEFGLVGAIHNFIDANTPGGLKAALEITDQLPPLNAALEVAVYRTIQEGFTNILHHSQAKNASIRISHKKTALMIDLIDDGIGLPARIAPGVGLISMQERADELGGKFNIIPASRGSHLQLVFPLNLEDHS